MLDVSLRVFMATSSGLRRAGAVGRRVFVLQLMRRWAGLDSIPCDGVLRWSRMTRNGLLPVSLHFLMILLAVFTADSALPLALLL